ncbi:MAG: type II secretion system secretin GspD [Casimicrobiaceae bacterium]|nr:type II secretion system secretin GspD [Casimicrobiaceae bacterium]
MNNKTVVDPMAVGAVRLVGLLVAALFGVVGLTAAFAQDLTPRAAASAPRSASQPSHETSATARSADATVTPRSGEEIKLGTGQTFRPPRGGAREGPAGGRPVSLSFENGDIREVVRNILGDLLGENYIIDPQVTGTVTMRTARPISENQVLALLESVLRSRGFALVREGNYWRVTTIAETRGLVQPLVQPQSGPPPRGMATTIVPIRHIGAKEIVRLIEPFVRDPQQALRIDELRNLLFITASQPETQRILDLVEMFDVDLLEGMSFALYRLQNGDVKSVMADYERIVGGQQGNPFAGLLRVLPLERMNAVLLMSPQPKVVQEARKWFERLDEGGADTGTGQRLYVYNLQYTQAEKLQPVLQAALTGRAAATPAATVAPGQQPATVSAPVSPIPGQPIVQPGNVVGTQPARPAAGAAPAGGQAAAGGAAAAVAQPLARNVSIVADKDRNALLIVATAAEYNAIESVIRRLDVPPKQVAIELQIAQVALTGDFKFGLQSYLQSGKFDAPSNNLSINEGSLRATPSGLFTYTWARGDLVKAILAASQSKGQTRTIAQPTLITLENQKATFTSGKQVSVRTQTTTGTGGNVISTDSFQYINTGINVSFTPRVTGRNILLEIQQEISDSQPSSNANNPNPDILRRAASTTVMVTSGDTMMMGGLFEESGGSGSAGFPFLSTIPVLGGLFGQQTWNHNRSELVMLITPRILDTEEDTREVIDELRRKLEAIERFVPSASTAQLPTRAEDRERLKREIRELNASLRVQSDHQHEANQPAAQPAP